MVTILLVWKHLSWFYYWPISCGRSRLIWWETSNPTLPTNNLQPKLLAILLYLLHPPAYTVQCSLPDMSRRHLSHGIPWLDHYDRKHWGISIKDWGQAILLYLQTPSSLHCSVFSVHYLLWEAPRTQSYSTYEHPPAYTVQCSLPAMSYSSDDWRSSNVTAPAVFFSTLPHCKTHSWDFTRLWAPITPV